MIRNAALVGELVNQIHYQVDPELVIPDPGRTLAEGALAPMTGSSSSEYFQRLLTALAEELHFSMETPFADLPEDWRCPNCDAPRTKFMRLDRHE